MTTPAEATSGGPLSSEFVSKSVSVRNASRGPLPRLRNSSRQYDVVWLSGSGDVISETISGRFLPILENACGSVARGTLVNTTAGPIAVEDLTPSDEVITSEYGPLPLQWIGSYEFLNQVSSPTEHARLLRVTSGAFGLNKPEQDLLLTEQAHALIRHPACQKLFGMENAFAPICAFEDGEHVISVTPASSVTVYNLAFDRQATIMANGVELGIWGL